MEQYLIEQYNVIEDENYLTSEEQIESYFKDYDEIFDCGQGYYQEKATVTCKIGDKFYEVDIYAEIGSAKQDRGDRLYWVEKIDEVVYEEVPKPEEKKKQAVQYSFSLTEKQTENLENLFAIYGFDFQKEYVNQ